MISTEKINTKIGSAARLASKKYIKNKMYCKDGYTAYDVYKRLAIPRRMRELSEKFLVVQSNKLIEARYRLSTNEQKIMRILIAAINKGDQDFQEYTFSVKKLQELLGVNTNAIYEVIDNTTDNLLGRVLRFEHDGGDWIKTSWLSSVEYRTGEGVVIMCFDPKLKPLLLQLKSHFTQYELGNILRLKSRYAIRIYEIGKQVVNLGQGEVVFDLADLRSRFELKPTEYPLFQNFRARILEPARREINDKTDLHYEWQRLRGGRGGKVHAIRFLFYHKRSAAANGEEPTADSMLAMLESMGVSPAMAQEICAQYAEYYIKQKVELAQRQGKVKNPAGFVVAAIKQNWTDEDMVRNPKPADQQRQKAQQDRDAAKLKADYAAFCQRQAFEHYQHLGKEAQDRIKQDFLAGCTGVIAAVYRKKADFGVEDGMFRAYVMSLFKAPPFEVWAKERGGAAARSGAGRVASC